MMNNPKVSIIVPIYNVQKYLEKDNPWSDFFD